MMEFPAFNKPPESIIDTSFRPVFIFENENENLDKRTVQSFGQEWKDFHDFSDKEIDDLGQSYFDIVNKEMLNEQHSALEVGCGSGRFIKYISGRAGNITGVDPSEAVFSANVLIGHNAKIRLVKSSAASLPFADESFDFVYAIGVLHHIPDTKKAMMDCVKKVKKGGHFLTYIYYNLDNRGLVFRFSFHIVNLIRKLIVLMPHRVKRVACDVLAIAVYMPFVLLCRLLKKCGTKEQLRKKIPLQFYEDKSFYVIRNDSLDRFGTPLEQRFSKQQIKEMMEESGLTDILFSDNMPYWHAIGKKM